MDILAKTATYGEPTRSWLIDLKTGAAKVVKRESSSNLDLMLSM